MAHALPKPKSQKQPGSMTSVFSKFSCLFFFFFQSNKNLTHGNCFKMIESCSCSLAGLRVRVISLSIVNDHIT